MARAGLTTDRVVTAAADLADEIGLEQVTVSALARGFGVKDPSLYSHVRNLDELRARVSVLATGELVDRLTAAVVGRAGREALGAFADAYRGYVLAHPGRYAAAQLQIPAETPGAELAHRRAGEITLAVLRGYGLAEPDLTDAVRLLRATLHGFAVLEGAGGFAHSRPAQASWERTVDALHTALTDWAGQGQRRA
ncbi:TetR/AcrR family transcriptional regulator [Kitasatospora azatica]|uniref:TetR/AcrR family transcriptional regulator n=1 Tax=Kitasatospora azatica TaxID=58347 RepID=UPI00055BFABC|nr:TetR/AcrR family transcriptional regulator [Kitasatospora azatica]